MTVLTLARPVAAQSGSRPPFPIGQEGTVVTIPNNSPAVGIDPADHPDITVSFPGSTSPTSGTVSIPHNSVKLDPKAKTGKAASQKTKAPLGASMDPLPVAEKQSTNHENGKRQNKPLPATVKPATEKYIGETEKHPGKAK